MTAPQPGDLYYRRLQLGTGATQDEIVHAYRRLAQRSHPDIHPEDPQAARHFREITEAYEVLSDPARRARYDGNRHAGEVIRVVPRTDSAPDGSWSRRRDSADVAPVVLGATSRLGDPLFLASPVRIEPHGGGPTGSPAASGGPNDGGVLWTLSEMLNRLWRR